MNSEKIKKREGFLIALLCVVQIWIVLQLLFQLKYFILDNPTDLVMANKSIIDCLTAKSIRMEVLYNVIHAFITKIFGNVPTTHYLLQYMFYLLNIFLVFLLIKLFGKKNRDEILLFFFVTIGTTVAENLFTIGKREIFLTTGLLLGGLVLFYLLFKENGKASLYFKLVFWMISLIFCLMIKETGIVILAFYFIMLFYAVFIKKNNRKAIILSLVGLIISIGIVQLYRINYIIENGTNYTSVSFNITSFINNLLYYLKYQIDIFVLGTVGIISGIVSFFKNKRDERRAYLLAINLTGWSYIVGMCIWRWALSYYLYPALVLFSISLLNLFFLEYKVIVRRTIWVFGGFLILFSTLNNWNVATSHIDMGKTYSESIDTLQKMTKTGDRILLENYTCYDEPSVQTNLLLNTYLGNDLSVIGINQNVTGIDPDPASLTIYGMTEDEYRDMKEEAWPRKNDYVVLYINNRDFYGPVRAVNPAYNDATDSKLKEMGYTLELIDAQSIDRYTIGFVNEKFKKKTMASGYKIFKVKDRSAVVSGYWEDGWTGKRIEIKDYSPKNDMQISINQIGYDLSKNTISILINEKKVSEEDIKTGDKIEINKYIFGEKTEKYNVVIEIKSTFIPSDKYPSDDNRELGININIE